MALDKTEEFMSRSPEWRIEAVIHDGSWWTVVKWAKLAKVKKGEVEAWIKKNKKTTGLIQLDDSYRVSYDEVIAWYKKQPDVHIKDRIVPNNFPPKIWDGQTEVEALIKTPRRKVTEVTITPDTQAMLNRCREALRGVAIVRFYRNGMYRACGLSPRFIEDTLRRELTPEEFAIVSPGRRTVLEYRELSDFSPDFLDRALDFYVPFARTLLRNRMSTLEIYLPTKNDIEMQIAMWVMIAFRKFDETQPVPFSGYLSRVLNFWPYDLPDEALGKELSGFQRSRQRAINKLVSTTGENEVPEEMIISEMDISQADYDRLSKEYRSWLAEHNASQLTWENSTNEREGALMWRTAPRTENPELAHAISVAICEAMLATGKRQEALKVINTIGSIESGDYEALTNLDKDFKYVLWQSIQESKEKQVSLEDIVS